MASEKASDENRMHVKRADRALQIWVQAVAATEKRRLVCVCRRELLAAIESGALLAYISANCSPLWIEARGYKRARRHPLQIASSKTSPLA